MRYIDYIKRLIASDKILILSISCAYAVAYSLGWTDQDASVIELTMGIATGMLLYVLGAALFYQYYDA